MLRRLASVTLALACSATLARAATFTIEPGKKSSVKFESKAPMETVTGKTQQVSGRVDLDPASLGDSITVQVQVDLASLDTGNGLRNRHMRENHLHTDKYPKAVFTGGKLKNLSQNTLANGQKVTGTITGQMELHGVKCPLEAPLELTRTPSGDLHVVSHFQVKLADYQIPRPQLLVMRLDETQRITFDVVASAQK